MLYSFAKLAEKRLKKLKINSQIEAALICSLTKKIIQDFFKGKINAKDSTLFGCSFKNGILKIKNIHSPYSNELRLNEEFLINKINEKLEKNRIKKIIF